jgi:hypothetical protein
MAPKRLVVLALFIPLGCGGSSDPVAPPDGTGDLSADVALDTAPPPVETTPDVTPDVNPIDPICAAQCAPFTDCEGTLHNTCITRCGSSETATCEAACLAELTTCEGAKECLGVEPQGNPFHEGPYGTAMRDVAGPFEMATTDGNFSMTESWTGKDSFIFLLTQTGIDYTAQLWNSPVYYWLRDSPKNVHYFFMAYPSKEGVDDTEAHVNTMKARVDPELEKLGVIYGKATECHWRRRVHYVPISAWTVGGWIQEMLQEKGRLGFAIDRFQRLRNVGLLQLVHATPFLYHTLFEAQYFDFEWEREQELVKEGVTTVTLFDNIHTKGGKVDVALPSAEEMKDFDTLEMDLTSNCVDHDESQCPEWDTGASLSIGEHPLEADNVNADTPCQEKVPTVEPSEEVFGSCDDGMACGPDSPCVDGTMCAGYAPSIEGSPEIAADTLPCWCAVPGSDNRESTHSCNNDGTGYNACDCGQSFEITRWITTYSREGRWVSDASEFLMLLKNGGPTRFHYSAGNKYVTTLQLRLYNQGKTMRPTEIHRLFGGGKFGPDYNSKYEPITIDIPADAKGVKVVARITGHGFGSDVANCAEFCNHTHHFTVNGTESKHDQPWVGKQYGCASQIPDGTVPNQFGTWTLGRAGWCPGLEVAPFIADVTDQVTPGEPATISYEGLFDGEDYVPIPNPGNVQNSFSANIWMESWLVIYN